MEFSLVTVEKPDNLNFILGQTHFIKSVEDIHEALVSTVPGIKFGLAFCEAGLRVLGFDLDPAKIEAISRGESYIRHIGPERVAAAVRGGRYGATTDFDRLGECDAILICVPTPLGSHREPDNSFIHATGREIARRLRRGQLVVLESTTYPGTTEDELRPILESSGLACGADFLLAFSPEREDPGRKDFTTKTIPKIVGGRDLAEVPGGGSGPAGPARPAPKPEPVKPEPEAAAGGEAAPSGETGQPAGGGRRGGDHRGARAARRYDLNRYPGRFAKRFCVVTDDGYRNHVVKGQGVHRQ